MKGLRAGLSFDSMSLEQSVGKMPPGRASWDTTLDLVTTVSTIPTAQDKNESNLAKFVSRDAKYEPVVPSVDDWTIVDQKNAKIPNGKLTEPNKR
jgi:hypothetical protein